jgi:hypothetical protein
MNPWSRLNLVLGALASVLLLALLLPRWLDPPAVERLTPLAAGDIDRIRIERDRRLMLAFERRADRWYLTHPEQGPARTQRIGQLLAIASAPLRRRLPADAPLADYGLATPAAVVQFNQQRIAFGGRVPAQRLRYVHLEDAVGLVDELYFNLLTLPQSHYLDD